MCRKCVVIDHMAGYIRKQITTRVLHGYMGFTKPTRTHTRAVPIPATRVGYPNPCHCLHPIPGPQPVYDPRAFSDASSTSIMIIIGQQWHTWSLIGDWKSNGCDIAWAESIGFELLVWAITSAGTSGICFKVFGDNIGVVEGWPNGQSQNKQVNNSFKHIHATLQDSQCQVIARYVPSENNPANAPSRGVHPPVHLLLPEVHIPSDIHPFLQDFVPKSNHLCEPFTIDWPCTHLEL